MPGFFLVYFFIRCCSFSAVTNRRLSTATMHADVKNVAASRARYSHAWINPIFATGACG